MGDSEAERKRKALLAMMSGESVSNIGTEFEERKPPVKRQCNDCGGTGKCMPCNGSGAEECTTCNGSGRVGAYHTKVIQGTDRYIVNQASAFGGTCPDCGGRGIKAKLWPITETVKCRFCGGNGKCKACSGNGYQMSR